MLLTDGHVYTHSPLQQLCLQECETDPWHQGGQLNLSCPIIIVLLVLVLLFRILAKKGPGTIFLGSHLSNWHWFTKYLFNLPRVIQDHFQYHSLHPSSGHSLYIKITYHNTGRAHLCLLGAIFNCALLQMRGSANSSETLFKLTTLPARSFCFHQSSGQKNIWNRFEIPTPFPFSHFQTFRLQNLPFIYIHWIAFYK